MLFLHLRYCSTITISGLFNMYQIVTYANRTSSFRNLVFHFITTLNSQQSINYTGPKHSNSLPYELKLVETHLTFERELQKFFLEIQT